MGETVRCNNMRVKHKSRSSANNNADPDGSGSGRAGATSSDSPGAQQPGLAMSRGSGKGVRRFAFLLFGILALAGLVLRFYHLQADPPLWGYVYNTDEGHYSYTAHNRLVFGHWFVNEAKYGLITPLFAFAQFQLAAIGGGDASIASYRLVSAVSGVLSCVLLALFFQDYWRRLAAVALASVSFMGFVHSRLGITEMLLTLMVQITVLFVWQAFKRGSFPLAALAGAAAVGSLMVKPTAVFITPILLMAPLLCRTPNRFRGPYWFGAATGAALAGLLWSWFIIMPFWDAWRRMMTQSTSFGREAFALDSTALQCLWHFFLSPALQTMPLLWPLALCWCLVSWIPRWWKGGNDLLDTILFLWIAAAVLILGTSTYQPARWQMLLFPPVICAGLRFLPDLRRPAMAATGLLAVLGSAGFYSLFQAGHFLSRGHQNEPASGVFGHSGPAITVLCVYVAAWFAARKVGAGRWQQLACGIIAVELAVQCWFHADYTWPAFFRPSQWNEVAKDLAQLPPRGTAVFSGEMVQDLSLRAKIHVLPTYYLLDEPTDAAIREFFVRQNAVPDYFVLLDNNVKKWVAGAPAFAASLEEVGHFSLIIGGIGIQKVHLCRFRSYDWLVRPDGQRPATGQAPQ